MAQSAFFKLFAILFVIDLLLDSKLIKFLFFFFLLFLLILLLPKLLFDSTLFLI